MKSKKLYSCSMAVLYVACRFGWDLYLKYQKSFAAMSAAYTPEVGQAAIAAIDKAKAMKDASQRRGTVSLQGVLLDKSSLSAILFWKTLRRYIIKVYPAAGRDAAIQQAGGAHFYKASHGNLADISLLLAAGKDYIDENLDDLLTKGTMPADFQDNYNTAAALYDEEHAGYGTAKGDATDGTTTKLTANNELYTNLQFMFGDAAVALAGQKAIAKQFSFAAVKRLVTKNMAGIHFTILDAAAKPITDAIIITDEAGEAFNVSKRGTAEIIMKTGTQSITVEAPGYGSYTGVVKVDAGIKHRVKISLIKEATTETIPQQTSPAEVAFTSQTQLEQ